MHPSHAAGEKEALRGHLRSALNTIQNIKGSMATPQKGNERTQQGAEYYERRKAAVEGFRSSGGENCPMPQHVSQVRKPSSFDPTGEDTKFSNSGGDGFYAREQAPQPRHTIEHPTKTYNYQSGRDYPSGNNYSFDDTPVAARVAAASPPTGPMAEALNDFMGFPSYPSNSQLTAPKSSLKPTSRYSPMKSQSQPQPQLKHQQQKIPKQYMTTGSGYGTPGNKGTLHRQLADALADTNKPLSYDELKILAGGELLNDPKTTMPKDFPSADPLEVLDSGYGESTMGGIDAEQPLRLNPSAKSVGDLAVRSNFVSQMVEKQLPYAKNNVAPVSHQALLAHPPSYEDNLPLNELASDLKVLDAKSELKLTRVGEMLRNKRKVGKRKIIAEFKEVLGIHQERGTAMVKACKMMTRGAEPEEPLYETALRDMHVGSLLPPC